MNIDAWLSLVERCVRDAEAAGTNPVASTPKNPGKSRFSGVFLLPGKGDFVSYSRIYSRIFSKHRIRPGDGWKNNSCRLRSEEGIRHLFCHPCLLLFGGAGIDVHGFGCLLTGIIISNHLFIRVHCNPWITEVGHFLGTFSI